VFPEQQEAVMELIRAVKRGRTGAPVRAALAALTEALRADTDAVLIACTELSVIADAIAPGAPVLDAMDVLAGEIVRLGAPDRAAGSAPRATG
ncbi:MAG: aspartate/glutamate racemase family protein, partial [Thermohalobaculum sp.]|nr:aspartate/glutamate racemase family protein [Thermohalobaculum sp.]